MSKWLLGILIGLFAFTAPVAAAPTEFLSPSYGIGSVIFGGTGTLRFPQSATPPTITSGPAVSSITETTAHVIWTVDRNSSGIVFVGTTSGSYPFQASDTLTASTPNHDVTLSFLIKNTQYFYKVRSLDAFGNMVESAEGTFTSAAGDVTPPVITAGPTVAQSSGTQVIVTWETDELSNSIVEYGIQNVSENSVGRTDERTLFHQVTLSGLTGGQAYLYRVRSTDSSGNVVTSANKTITTVSSPGITEVRITDVTLNSAVVQWKTTVQSSTKASYGVKSGVYDDSVEDASLSETHLIRLTGLASGTTIYLRLSGVDGFGTQVSSDEYVFSTVILPTISDIEIFDIGSRSAKLRWTASSEVDAFVRYEITASADTTVIGKKFATGDDKLSTEHVIQLNDLESAATYSVSALGKDVFGNQAISPTKSFVTLQDNEPPRIENLKSDTTVDLGSRQTVQVLVSFGISEPAKAVIEYGDGATGDYNQKVDTDVGFSNSKFMVIPNLKPGNSYHFRVIVTDRAGNTNEKEALDYLVLAPAQPVSLLDLIFGQLRSNFGWLLNVGS